MVISTETVNALADANVIKNLKLNNVKLSNARLKDLQVILSKNSFGRKQVFDLLTTISKNVTIEKTKINQQNLLELLSRYDNSIEYTDVNEYVDELINIFSVDKSVMSTSEVLVELKDVFHKYKLEKHEMDENDFRAIKTITCLLYYFIVNKESVKESIGCREFNTILYASSFLCYSLSC